MNPRKPFKDASPGSTPAAFATPSPIERAVKAIVEGLPILDPKSLANAVAEVRQHPRMSLQYLLEKFAGSDPATRAVCARILLEFGGADVVDNLNAIIFDISQDAMVKVAANDLLAELGAPVDPDVFAMSVPNAEELQRALPSRTLKLLKDGNYAGAAEHARTLHPAERWLIIQKAAAVEREKSIPFLEALARDEEGNAVAAAAAIAHEKLAAGVPLLLELQRSGGRDLQKLVKRLLFELRKEGVAIPDEKARDISAPPAEAPDEELPLYRAMVSEPSPEGLILVMVARTRPNGRLKVFSVLVDLWKRGIQQAGLRIDMGRSSFDRFVESQPASRLKMREATIAEARRIVARGVRVAQECGSPLPFDFGVGRPLLGDLEKEIASIENPFLCSGCGKPLDRETVEKIRAAAAYEHIHVETRCTGCRGTPSST